MQQNVRVHHQNPIGGCLVENLLTRCRGALDAAERDPPRGVGCDCVARFRCRSSGVDVSHQPFSPLARAGLRGVVDHDQFTLRDVGDVHAESVEGEVQPVEIVVRCDADCETRFAHGVA